MCSLLCDCFPLLRLKASPSARSRSWKWDTPRVHPTSLPHHSECPRSSGAPSVPRGKAEGASWLAGQVRDRSWFQGPSWRGCKRKVRAAPGQRAGLRSGQQGRLLPLPTPRAPPLSRAVGKEARKGTAPPGTHRQLPQAWVPALRRRGGTRPGNGRLLQRICKQIKCTFL